MVVNELCHYADANVSDLHVNILLGRKTWVVESFESFVGKDSRRVEAVARLHNNRYPFEVVFSF